MVRDFSEKPVESAARTNSGFFVMGLQIFGELGGDSCVLETEVFPVLARNGQLGALIHDGFWMPMDTMRVEEMLEQLALDSVPPWERCFGFA